MQHSFELFTACFHTFLTTTPTMDNRISHIILLVLLRGANWHSKQGFMSPSQFYSHKHTHLHCLLRPIYISHYHSIFVSFKLNKHTAMSTKQKATDSPGTPSKHISKVLTLAEKIKSYRSHEQWS